MWFDKSDPKATFVDIRTEDRKLDSGHHIKVRPDILADFRSLPFQNEAFDMVVFDPPHFKRLGKTSWLAAKYGALLPSWRDDITEGFKEAFRVLKPSGTLVFKWNEYQIPLTEILNLTPHKPLFGHTSGRSAMTHWVIFSKEGTK